MADLLNTNPNETYGDDAIVTLSPREHIRLRPGMYIGKLGDGSQADDGIYVLIKEVVDNSVDEFIMGAGREIDITIEDNVVSVRDFGRGIPLKSLAAAVSEMNTGGKYGGTAFKKTVGLNGVGVKAVNMLSSEFTARSVRDGEARTVTFAKGSSRATAGSRVSRRRTAPTSPFASMRRFSGNMPTTSSTSSRWSRTIPT